MSLHNIIDFSIYAKLWKAGDAGVMRMQANQDLVYVPHTILYLEGVPYSWYFTSLSDGKYKRRSKKKLVSEEIYLHFRKQWRNRKRAQLRSQGVASPRTKKSNGTTYKSKTEGSESNPHSASVLSETPPDHEDVSEDMLVAVWMQNIIVNGSEAPQCVPRFFTLQELHHFLFSETKSKSAGILQEMVHHHGSKRRGLRCHWSPHISTVEMCINRWNITNTKVDIDHRMADVNGRRGDIIVTKLDQATKLGHRIKSLSNILAMRIEQIVNTSREGRLMVDMSKTTTGSSLVQEGNEKMMISKGKQKARQMKTERGKLGKEVSGNPSSIASTVFAKSAAKSIAKRAAMTEEELSLEALKKAEAARQTIQVNSKSMISSAEYFAPYIKGATFETKRNLLGIRFKRGTFNFAIGDDNRTYLTFCCGVEIVDRQPAFQKRKKRSNAHTLEIEMLETATRTQRDFHKEVPSKPKPSPILERMGLGLLPRPEEEFYKNYSNKNYEPEPDGGSSDDRDQLAGTGFSVREMLRDGAEMLRAFFRRYAHAKTGRLNLRSVFQTLDTSGDGMISSVEFRDLFREVNIHLTRNQLFQVVRLFDENCDGRVSIDEFENWIMTDPVQREDTSVVDHSDDVFNVRKAINNEDSGLKAMGPWGHRISETGAKLKLDPNSVLGRRMRAVGDETKVSILNSRLAEFGAQIESASAELESDLNSIKDPSLDDDKTPAERVVAHVLGDTMDGTVTLNRHGKNFDSNKIRVPKSVEKAYGRYRAHYLSSITVPMTQQSRNAKAFGIHPSPRSKSGPGTGRILKLAQSNRNPPKQPEKKDETREGATVLPPDYYKPGNYGKIYDQKVKSSRYSMKLSSQKISNRRTKTTNNKATAHMSPTPPSTRNV